MLAFPLFHTAAAFNTPAALIGSGRLPRALRAPQTVLSALELELLSPEYIAALGFLTANTKALSPLTSVLSVRESRNLGDLNPVPLLAITFNNIGWGLYSLCVHDANILAATLPGVCLGGFYVATAYEHAPARVRSDLLAMAACYATALGGACAAAACVAGVEARDALGATAMALLLAFYASTAPALSEAVRTCSAARIHVPLAAATLLNAALWLTYGLQSGDAYVYLPHTFGAAIACSQLGVAGALRPTREVMGLPDTSVVIFSMSVRSFLRQLGSGTALFFV